MADTVPPHDTAGSSNLSNNPAPQPNPTFHTFSAEGLSAIVKEGVGGVKNYIDEALALQKEQTVRSIETS